MEKPDQELPLFESQDTAVVERRSLPQATFARWSRLCLKELRETLRDRRTIVTLVLMPLLVYPLLSMIFNNFLLSSASSITKLTCIIATDSEESLRELERLVRLGEQALRQRNALPPPDLDEQSPEARNWIGMFDPEVHWRFGDNLQRQVGDGSVDVAVYLTRQKNDPDAADGGRGLAPSNDVRCQLYFREDSALSQAGLDFLTRRLRAANEVFLVDALQRQEVELRPMDQVTVQQRGIEAEGGESSLKTVVPLILILMTITGAVYPAIDLTAGERERGTLETLMAAPVPRLGLLSAKYIAVLTVALFTATANLAAMTVTLVATGLGPLVFGESGPPPVMISAVFALLILFAAFFSAILLALTSFARSFKEAQAYLVPVMLLSLAPGIVSLMPDLKFNGVLAVTPLVNIVLLARDILEGRADGILAAAAVVSTALYAIAALTVAARVFGTDAVLYGADGGWSDLWFRPEHPRPVATVSGAMLCLAVLFPAYFLLSNILQQVVDASLSLRLGMSAMVTMLLFVGLPVAAAMVQRVRLPGGFQLRPVGPLAFAAALAMGLALWPFAHELYLLNRQLGLGGLDAQKIEAVQNLLEQFQTISPVVILLTLAMTPAVCEELFFRGYLLGSLRPVMRPWKAILVSGLLFGAFHVITTSVLSVERFLPSTMMGFVLGWVCVRTSSVLPGMLLHAAHNGVLLMIAYYRDTLLEKGWGIEEQAHLPATWLIAAAAVVLVSGGILFAVTRGHRAPGVTTRAPDDGHADAAHTPAVDVAPNQPDNPS